MLFLNFFTLFLPVEGKFGNRKLVFNKFYWSENALYFYYAYFMPCIFKRLLAQFIQVLIPIYILAPDL